MCHAQFMYMIEEKAKCMNIVCKTYMSVDRMHENHAYKKMYVKYVLFQITFLLVYSCLQQACSQTFSIGGGWRLEDLKNS